jgi:hypothetical protein
MSVERAPPPVKLSGDIPSVSFKCDRPGELMSGDIDFVIRSLNRLDCSPRNAEFGSVVAIFDSIRLDRSPGNPLLASVEDVPALLNLLLCLLLPPETFIAFSHPG